MTSDDCKKLIVKYCLDNKTHINGQFCEPLSDDTYKQTLNIKNWKRMSKGKDYDKRGIERVFDCIPFDDQLRATVITDHADEIILELFVCGE